MWSGGLWEWQSKIQAGIQEKGEAATLEEFKTKEDAFSSNKSKHTLAGSTLFVYIKLQCYSLPHSTGVAVTIFPMKHMRKSRTLACPRLLQE